MVSLLSAKPMPTHIWTVIMFFGRDKVETLTFTSKEDAKRAVDIALFNNEDTVQCMIYRTKV